MQWVGAAIVLAVTTGPILAVDDLANTIASFRAESSELSADKLVAATERAAERGDWAAITAIDLDLLQEVLLQLKPGRASELLLLAAQAKGHAGAPVEQDKVVSMAERFAREHLPDQDARLTLVINLGYVYLQTNRAEEALSRLDGARLKLERANDAEALMNLCGLAPSSFERSGHIEQAGQLYLACDESEVVRSNPTPRRGFFWHNHAMFLQGRAAFEEAIRRHRWALQDLGNYYGLPSRQVVDAYDGFGQTMLAAGDLGVADSLASLAIQFSSELDGAETSASHWRLVNNAAAVKRALRLPARALELDYAAFDWRRQNLGKDHSDTYISWLNYALDLVEMERWEDAKAQFLNLYRGYGDGSPIPYPKDILSYYLFYLDARIAFERGESFTLPKPDLLVRTGTPLELVEGVMHLLAQNDLSKGRVAEALELAAWNERFMTRNVGETHPSRFAAAFLHARVLGEQDKAAASKKLAETDIELFNWTRRQSLSGSYDASLASRALADDLMLYMAHHALEVPEFMPHFAEAIHRWKVLESPADRALQQVARTSSDTALRAAARDYRLSAARFRERVRAEPVTEEITAMDNDLNKQRKLLNVSLTAAGLPEVEPPLAPIKKTGPSLSVKPGEVVIDMIVLRDWRRPDRDGWSKHLELYAAIHRADTPPRIARIAELDFTARAAEGIYDSLWRDIGLWVSREVKDAERVFIAPDAMLFQMDLLAARDEKGRRLGTVNDIHLLSTRAAYETHNEAAAFKAGTRVVVAGGLFYTEEKEADPDFLPGSLREVDRIAALVEEGGGVSNTLRGFEASVSRVSSAAREGDILHLATHGFFIRNQSEPYSLRNAGLLLSNSSDGQDEDIVYASEVMDWDLSSAQLVVLSSCNSGVGYDTPIDAVRGLPLALARAGARRSLVTLEEIPDFQTARVMERFYQHVTTGGMTYSEAFLLTKREIWANEIDGVSEDVASAFVLYLH